jgi:glutathione S-transferase
MVDSETTRLLCHWYGIDFREEDHLFGWASALTVLHGGYGRVPLLYGGGLKLSGPRAVVDHFDPSATPERQLLREGGEAAGVEADWSTYNGSLGLDVAVFAYFHLLSARALMEPVFAAPVPLREARLTPRVYPLLHWLFTVLLRLNPARAKLASQRIRTVFAAMDRRLADERSFLMGPRLTLGDVAFAGASAPLLQPDGYGTVMPALDAMPTPVRDLVLDLRRSRTALYVERVYWTVIKTGANARG